MKTKEEILDAHITKLTEEYPDDYLSLEKIKTLPIYVMQLKAMEDYAKEVALAFYEYEESVTVENMEAPFDRFISKQP